MSKSAISAIECGRSNPTIETLERIAAGLGLDLAIFFVSPHSGYRRREQAA